MQIAQIAPLTEAVPPKLYGGTERVVSYLTEELVAMGHDVTLFASGDSITDAKLDAVWPRALRLDPDVRDPLALTFMLLEQIGRRGKEFDIVHSHVDYLAYPILSRLRVPFVTTLHGRLDMPELQHLYRVYNKVPLVSVSDSQREPLTHPNYVATVYHGLPERLLKPGGGEGGYLAFLGRISPEKAPDAAIRIAQKAGMKLKIAAKVDRADVDYFESQIRPLLDSPLVEYIGEINEGQKDEFLGNAAGLLFPIAWREPFGLVMIEAMACGTPVIAMRNGSVTEVLEDGLTAFIVEGEDTAAAAARNLGHLNRARIRREFEARFTARRMAENYLAVYRALLPESQEHMRAAG